MEEENSQVEDHNVEQLTTSQIKQKAQVSFLLFILHILYIFNN